MSPLHRPLLIAVLLVLENLVDAQQTRRKIQQLRVVRLAVHRSNTHMYAQVIDASGAKVLASASTIEPEIRSTSSASRAAS